MPALFSRVTSSLTICWISSRMSVEMRFGSSPMSAKRDFFESFSEWPSRAARALGADVLMQVASGRVGVALALRHLRHHLLRAAHDRVLHVGGLVLDEALHGADHLVDRALHLLVVPEPLTGGLDLLVAPTAGSRAEDVPDRGTGEKDDPALHGKLLVRSRMTCAPLYRRAPDASGSSPMISREPAGLDGPFRA